MPADKDRSRDWAFTDYEQNEEILQGLPYDYLCYGEEICPETKRPHLQCYVRFGNAKSFSAVRKLLAPRHIEASLGTPAQNIGYCKGDYTTKKGKYKPLNEVFKEFGTRPAQGARTDISNTMSKIKAGGYTLRDVVAEATSYQAVRMAEVQFKYFETHRTWKPEVFWFYGATETGKTRTAHEMMPNPYMAMDTNRWWEGYDGHEDVIIDDFRPSFCSFSNLLRLTDRYEHRVECKGGSRQFLAKRIIFTSAYSPTECWEGKTRERLGQFLRRITEIRCFDEQLSD